MEEIWLEKILEECKHQIDENDDLKCDGEGHMGPNYSRSSFDTCKEHEHKGMLPIFRRMATLMAL